MTNYIIFLYCFKITIATNLGNFTASNITVSLGKIFQFNYKIAATYIPSFEFKPLNMNNDSISRIEENYSQLRLMLENIKIIKLSDKIIQTLLYCIEHYPHIILPFFIFLSITIIRNISTLLRYEIKDTSNKNVKSSTKNIIPKFSFFNKDKRNLLKKTQPYNTNYIVNMADKDRDTRQYKDILPAPDSRRVQVVGTRRIR